ncbi:LPS export ABC transporter permease LptF [Pantoea sp. Nvir]|uniref:LPS export ABC transporter permease LptF n=1 Tax=Pantoea sp. Nvir TaxID=2576760 RepID=UPI001357DC8E|nr:LPS export ABC transporter permease LptF [Pantoea sp. Nvir]MXP66415.1 LPS export ABC transporter permease LptF [Pantoea sp. Nvir]CAJ0993239.1 Lipopolysaccharide export system permease protein LptF [Pantoea sp. Nvir]
MIIIRYLVRETLKSQLAILFILLLIFSCQKIVRILGAAVDREIPTNLIITLLGLRVPEMAQLILPLSLFLAMLMTLGKLYTESEITVMHACGLGKSMLMKAAILLIFLTSIVAMVNVIWLVPWSSRYQDEVMQNVKANASATMLAPGQFQTSDDGNTVLFIENVKGRHFNNVFLAQLHPTGNARSSVVLADSGHIERNKDGFQVITLYQGARFEGSAMSRYFRITDFTNYQALISHKEIIYDPNNAEKSDLTTLLSKNTPAFRAEFHWRLTLIFSVLVMALIVLPLSTVNLRQERILSMLPAMLLYLIFFLVQSSLKLNGAKGHLDPAYWMWAINIGYLLLAIVLNLWDTVLMRYVYAKFSHIFSV